MDREGIGKIEAPMSLSIDSWKGLALYVEGGDTTTGSRIVSDVMAYQRHCLRCLWNVDPVSKSTYRIQRVNNVVGKLDFGDDFTFLVDSELVDDYENQQREHVNQFVPGDTYEEQEENEKDDRVEEFDELDFDVGAAMAKEEELAKKYKK